MIEAGDKKTILTKKTCLDDLSRIRSLVHPFNPFATGFKKLLVEKVNSWKKDSPTLDEVQNFSRGFSEWYEQKKLPRKKGESIVEGDEKDKACVAFSEKMKKFIQQKTVAQPQVPVFNNPKYTDSIIRIWVERLNKIRDLAHKSVERNTHLDRIIEEVESWVGYPLVYEEVAAFYKNFNAWRSEKDGKGRIKIIDHYQLLLAFPDKIKKFLEDFQKQAAENFDAMQFDIAPIDDSEKKIVIAKWIKKLTVIRRLVHKNNFTTTDLDKIIQKIEAWKDAPLTYQAVKACHEEFSTWHENKKHRKSKPIVEGDERDGLCKNFTVRMEKMLGRLLEQEVVSFSTMAASIKQEPGEVKEGAESEVLPNSVLPKKGLFENVNLIIATMGFGFSAHDESFEDVGLDKVVEIKGRLQMFVINTREMLALQNRMAEIQTFVAVNPGHAKRGETLLAILLDNFLLKLHRHLEVLAWLESSGSGEYLNRETHDMYPSWARGTKQLMGLVQQDIASLNSELLGEEVGGEIKSLQDRHAGFLGRLALLTPAPLKPEPVVVLQKQKDEVPVVVNSKLLKGEIPVAQDDGRVEQLAQRTELSVSVSSVVELQEQEGDPAVVERAEGNSSDSEPESTSSLDFSDELEAGRLPSRRVLPPKVGLSQKAKSVIQAFRLTGQAANLLSAGQFKQRGPASSQDHGNQKAPVPPSPGSDEEYLSGSDEGDELDRQSMQS